MTPQHPWSRYVAIGDSFTEGIGDPEPRSPGGHRGWADRVAEVLSEQTDDFALFELEVEIADDRASAETFLQTDGLEHYFLIADLSD